MKSVMKKQESISWKKKRKKVRAEENNQTQL